MRLADRRAGGDAFDRDPLPGRPRILFVGLATSSHTHAWVDLVADAAFNVRLFAWPMAPPPAEWKIKTYATHAPAPDLDPDTRRSTYARSRPARLLRGLAGRLRGRSATETAEVWLAEAIRAWRPDVVHTLGLEAGKFYCRMRERHRHAGDGRWVLQLRGGFDTAFALADPERRESLGRILRGCHRLLTDNELNLRLGRVVGMREEQLPELGTVPGTGGIDIDAMQGEGRTAPADRRLVLWPKAYECAASKALPVLEALRISWPRIAPCEVHLLAVNDEARAWYSTLPEEIRRHCHPSPRIPRPRVLALMAQARVMLAPSLIDGLPNVLLEAMAGGALPIVSPLETIRGVVRHEENVLFARNLYPDEIAAALVRAMSDDTLVTRAATSNLARVRQIADRARIRVRVQRFYEHLAGSDA